MVAKASDQERPPQAMPTSCAAMKAGAVSGSAISTLSTSCFLARNALLHDRAGFIPAARVVHDLYYRKHDWDFD
jgi:hypothetical protein